MWTQTPWTQTQAASLSKQFVAACVLSLADSGRLDLHEPLARHLPEAAEQWRRATLHALLTHTAGVSHWGGAPGPAFDPLADLDVETRIDDILRSERGSADWRYSSPGYLVIGRVVERATGMSYGDVLAERLLKPLGLTSTTVSPRDGVTAAPAVGHRDGEPVTWNPGTLVGTNDLWTTEADIETWTTALHAGPYAARMTHPHAKLPPDADWLSASGYGYGLYIGELGTGTSAAQPAMFHLGDVPGFRSVAVWLPREQRAIAVLSDEESADVLAILRERLQNRGR